MKGTAKLAVTFRQFLPLPFQTRAVQLMEGGIPSDGRPRGDQEAEEYPGESYMASRSDEIHLRPVRVPPSRRDTDNPGFPSVYSLTHFPALTSHRNGRPPSSRPGLSLPDIAPPPVRTQKSHSTMEEARHGDTQHWNYGEPPMKAPLSVPPPSRSNPPPFPHQGPWYPTPSYPPPIPPMPSPPVMGDQLNAARTGLHRPFHGEPTAVPLPGSWCPDANFRSQPREYALQLMSMASQLLNQHKSF